MRLSCLSLLLAAAWLLSIASTTQAEDAVLHATVKLATPKKEGDKRSKPPYDETQIHLWVPGDVQVLRGAVFNPFYADAVGQEHWQEAGRLWGFGILAGDFFGVRGEEFGDILARGLENMAAENKRPEIANLVICPVGMSAGAGMSTRFAEQLPGRTVAVGPVCLEVGPRDDASRLIPTITIFGERDGAQMEKLAAKLPLERAAGARFATAVQWGRKHEFARANNLVMVLFDRALQARWPEEADSAKSAPALRELPEDSGWLVDISSWQEPLPRAAAWAEYKGNRAAAGWVPDAYTAACWQAFVVQKSPVKFKAPAGMGDGAELVVHKPSAPIAVEAVVPENTKTATLYNGERPIAELKLEGTNATGTIEGLPPGVHGLSVRIAREGEPETTSTLNTILVGKE